VVFTPERPVLPATQPPSGVGDTEQTRLRLTFLGLLVVSLFVLLFARLWFLQVMAGERYATLAEVNAVRTVAVEAPRGRILDRHGEAIVRNRFALVVSVQPAEMGDRRDAVLADLADLLGTDVANLEETIERSRVSPLRPKPVAVDVPEDIVFYIHENASTRYPGVYAERLPLRTYPQGTLAAHLVGYVGEISAEELEREERADYRPGDLIGWSGLERTYEAALRGTEGVRRLEVNARGQVLRTLQEDLPVAGADLTLTVDLEAQRLTERALREGIAIARRITDPQGRADGTYQAPAGAAVVLDARTGAVVSMASYPTFEPERFVGGVSQDYWSWLQDPDSAFPLINRAVQSSYPPGSVYKVVSAAAALEYGYMAPGARLECPGQWEWGPSTYRNWKRTHSGHLTMVEALVESCDTVFYELARRMWNDEQREQSEGRESFERLSEQSKAWGLGERTGIDLPGERAGVVPGRTWKRDFWENYRDTYCAKAQQLPVGSYAQLVNAELCEEGFRWRGGDAVNMSIGQGDLQTTPLQIALNFAAIANRGPFHRPHLVSTITHRDGTTEQIEPEVLGELPVSQDTLDYIEQGLLGVTAPGGTAGGVFSGFPVRLAGKTGTAELKPKQPFAWFAAYGPVGAGGPDDPQYVVVALVEEGGGGSETAAPIVKRIFEGLLGLQEAPIVPGERTE
jgi:penicillin-binding protein 2